MKGSHPSTFIKDKPPQKNVSSVQIPQAAQVPYKEQSNLVTLQSSPQQIAGLLVSWDLDGKRFSSVSLVLGTVLSTSCSQVAGERVLKLLHCTGLWFVQDLVM